MCLPSPFQEQGPLHQPKQSEEWYISKHILLEHLLRNSFLDTITIKLSSVSSWSLALFYVHINNDNKFNQTGHKKVLFEYKYI